MIVPHRQRGSLRREAVSLGLFRVPLSGPAAARRGLDKMAAADSGPAPHRAS
jgi:hypothetical protein